MIALAIIVNLIVAAVVGTLLPGYLKSLQIDPALAGGVVLTTVTDVVGFFCFLGIATLVYALLAAGNHHFLKKHGACCD